MTALAEIREVLSTIESLRGVWRAAWVPNRALFPYASILDPLSEVPELEGDAETKALRRTWQLDLWQKEEEEIDGLPEQVVDLLDGTKTTSGYRLRIVDLRLIQEEDDIVHHAITGDLVRLR